MNLPKKETLEYIRDLGSAVIVVGIAAYVVVQMWRAPEKLVKNATKKIGL